MKINKTGRGFGIVEFKDRDGLKCSLQKSSLATTHCIWLGVDRPDLVIHSGGRYVVTPLPEDWEVHSRMQLTRDQVSELLPILQKFVETGDL